MSKISGPLMDRIDIQTDVPAVPYKEHSNTRSSESSEAIRTRLIAARSVQVRRSFDEHIHTNAQMGPRQIRKYCVLTPECEKIMENAAAKLGFYARGYDRILKRNRTTGCARNPDTNQTDTESSGHGSTAVSRKSRPFPAAHSQPSVPTSMAHTPAGRTFTRSSPT
jgi:magnesium chelatase family protein